MKKSNINRILTTLFTRGLAQHRLPFLKQTLMVITESSRGYECVFEYRPAIVKELKQMHGVRFQGKERGWHIPFIGNRKNADGTTTNLSNKDAMERFRAKHTVTAPGADAAEQFFKIDDLPELNVSIPWRAGVTPYDYQGKGIARGLQLRKFINGDQPGLGKMQGVNDGVLTPTGWKKMGDLRPGNYVIGSNGEPTKVLKIFPQGEKQLYRVSFSDGFSVTCGAEHLWNVQKSGTQNHYTLTTAQMMIEGSFIEHSGAGHNKNKRYKFGTYIKDTDGKCRFKIPMVKPVKFAPQQKPILEPYLLGLFLGDGHTNKNNATLTLYDKDFYCLLPYLKHYTSYTHIPKKSSYSVYMDGDFRHLIWVLKLDCKLHDSKFIPTQYLTASPEDRLSLIQGLMDSDGHASKSSTEFSTTSKQLCDGIVELVQSLGGIARVKIKEKPSYKYKGEKLIGKRAYRVNIKMPADVNPFRCKRKSGDYMEPYHYMPERYIRSIEPDRIEESVCILVDAPDHLYVTEHYIVTHNTIQSIGTILGFEAMGENPYPCLVICPSTLKENWRREIEEKFSHKRAIILHDKNRHTWHQYHRMGMADFFIVNYESLWSYFVTGTRAKKGAKPKLNEIDFNPLIGMFKSIIIDELHKLKDPTTRQAKVAKGITTGKEIIIGLTGTPVVNKPKDLNSQLSMIGQLPKFGGYRYFLDRYCQGGSGAANLNELNGKLNNLCFFRREKKDVLHDLPDKMREVFTCDITTRAEYNLAKNDLGAFLKESGYSQKQIDKSLNAEIMVKIGKLKAISARGKLPEAIEHIQEVVDADEKIVVFINQKFMANAIMSAFPGSVSVRGTEIDENTGKEKSQSAESRQHAVDQFQNNPAVKVIVCSIKAAGVGITLTASSRLIFLELPWHPADVEQCEDRIHRIGQKNSAQISYFLGKDTIDEEIYKMIEKKREVSDAITGTTTTIDTMITDLTRSLFNQK